MSQDPQLLPPNSTPLERAVDATAAVRLADLSVQIRHLWNAALCPTAWLPALAWAFSVDVWRSDWPVATKRAVIAASPRVHRLKGTVAAVKTAITAVADGVPTRLIEWFHAGESGVPYTARVEISIEDRSSVNPLLTRDVLAAVEASKNARSRVDVRMVATRSARLTGAAFIRRPVIVARLDAVGAFRPSFQAPLASAALLRPPLVGVNLAGTSL